MKALTSCLVEDVGVVPCTQGDVSDTKLRHGSDLRTIADDALRRVDEREDTAIVINEELGSTQGLCFRGLAAHILRHVSQRHTHKVLAGLRLIEYLDADAVYSVEMHIKPQVARGNDTRIAKLRLSVASYETRVPTAPLSSEICAILRPAEQDRLRTLLDLVHAFLEIDVPIETPQDRRRVRALAAGLSCSEDRLLSEWGRAALYAPEPAKKFARALYRATIEWCVSIINDVWSSLLAQGPRVGATLVLTRCATVDGTKFASFASFIAGEALAQHLAEMLPIVDIGNLPPSMRPAVEEIPCLRGTGFAHAAQAIFGEAGLLHFLTSGWRSEAAISNYVEMIRDGDLAMRRYFGPRAREAVRIRAGEILVPFDLQPISASTACEPFGVFDVGRAEGPRWVGRDPKAVPKSPILRFVAELDACTKVIRGQSGVSVVVYSDDDLKRQLLPAVARLVYVWKDQVRMSDLAEYTNNLGLGGDPIAVLDSVFGDQQTLASKSSPAQGMLYTVVGDDLHFASGKLNELYRALENHAAKHGIQNVPAPTNTARVDPSTLPSSWVTSKKQRLMNADWVKTVPHKPPTRQSASRAPLKEVALQDAPALKEGWADPAGLFKHMHYKQPRDTRRKPQAVDHGHNARILFMTNRYIHQDDLIAKAQEDAENLLGYADERAAIMQELFGVSHEDERQFDHRDPSRDSMGIPPRLVKRLDRFRAMHKAQLERSQMAQLQMEHVAAAKIQLGWYSYALRRKFAAGRIQAFFRARLFRDVMRGINHAKLALLAEDQAAAQRNTVQSATDRLSKKLVASSQVVNLVLPFNGTKFSDLSLRQKVASLLSEHIGIPKDLDNRIINIEETDPDFQKGTMTLKLRVPYRVGPIVEQLQHSVDLDVTRRTRLSPLVTLIDALGGWEVTQNRSPSTSKKLVGGSWEADREQAAQSKSTQRQSSALKADATRAAATRR
jgi:hypothetical protein